MILGGSPAGSVKPLESLFNFQSRKASTMDMLVVSGGRRLTGKVTVEGSKNAALPIMAASLAIDGCIELDRIPRLADVHTLSLVLDSLGVRVDRRDDERMSLQVTDSRHCVADYELVRRMRASICVLGPLLARRGRAVVSLPGGCNLGHRPIDLHLRGLRALGAKISIEHGYLVAEAGRLRGAGIHLAGPFGSTVTGTCNVMTAATLARGITRIAGAAREPEVEDLGRFLVAAGARIEGLGTDVITIEGVESLTAPRYAIIPDRIEAATLLLAGAITQGCLEVEGADPSHLTAVIEVLREAGVTIERTATGLVSSMTNRPTAGRFVTGPYPAFPTDLQSQLTSLLTLTAGTSIVEDRIFPDRFTHLPELVRLGADVTREGGAAVIRGVACLSGAGVMASDLRAAAALVLAALAAEGDSAIHRIYHLDRGYHRLEQKLSQLGAGITRMDDTPENLPPDLRPPGMETALS